MAVIWSTNPVYHFSTSVEKQQLKSNKHNEKKNKNKKRMNAEHGEENVQVKAHAYVHRWVDRIYVKEFDVVRIFLAIKKIEK